MNGFMADEMRHENKETQQNRKEQKKKSEAVSPFLLLIFFYPQQTNESAALKHGKEGETARNNGRDEATESERERE